MAFLKLHLGQLSLSFLEGMATNKPLLPSMTLTFLTTNMLSNVNVAYAFNFLSWPSFKNIFTSVISIADTLLCSSLLQASVFTINTRQDFLSRGATELNNRS